MTRNPPNGLTYINRQFKNYCQRHAHNPVAPFELYTGFLALAKERERFGR